MANMQCVTCGKKARDTPWPTIWQMLRQLKSEGWNTVYRVCPLCVDKVDRWRGKPLAPLRLRRRRAKRN